jgi:hypothetical protein
MLACQQPGRTLDAELLMCNTVKILNRSEFHLYPNTSDVLRAALGFCRQGTINACTY